MNAELHIQNYHGDHYVICTYSQFEVTTYKSKMMTVVVYGCGLDGPRRFENVTKVDCITDLAPRSVQPQRQNTGADLNTGTNLELNAKDVNL